MKITVTSNFGKINKSATEGGPKKGIIVIKNQSKKGCGGCSRNRNK